MWEIRERAPLKVHSYRRCLVCPPRLNGPCLLRCEATRWVACLFSLALAVQSLAIGDWQHCRHLAQVRWTVAWLSWVLCYFLSDGSTGPENTGNADEIAAACIPKCNSHRFWFPHYCRCWLEYDKCILNTKNQEGMTDWLRACCFTVFSQRHRDDPELARLTQWSSFTFLRARSKPCQRNHPSSSYTGCFDVEAQWEKVAGKFHFFFVMER